MRWRLISLLLASSLVTRGARAEVQCGSFASAATLPAGTLVCGAMVPLAAFVSQDGGFVRDCAHRYTLRAGDGVRGQWGYLAFPPCLEGVCASKTTGGSRDLECQLANGYACGPMIGAYVRTLTGARPGALRDGMTTRFAADTDQRAGICFTDYLGNGRRVIDVPVVQSYGDQVHVVKVVGFAAFFLTRVPADGDDTVEGQFLYNVLPGCCGATAR